MARMSLLQSGYWQPLMHGELNYRKAKRLSFFVFVLLLFDLLLFEATE